MKEPALEMLLKAKEQRACLPASSFVFLFGILFSLFFCNFQLRLTNINFDFCSLLLLPAVFLGISARVALIVVFPHFVSV